MMLRAIRNHYRQWLRRNGLPPHGYTTDEWRDAWRAERGREVRREVEYRRAEHDRLNAATARRHLLSGLGAQAEPAYVPWNIDAGDVEPHLRELWAAVDALERRTRPT